jgi:hypothetical protein
MHPRITICLLTMSLLLAPFSSPGFAQSNTSSQPSSDPQAILLANEALVALGAANITDVTATGTVTRSVGPDSETGTFNLKALGLTQSRMDLNLPSGVLTELRSISNGLPTGAWISRGTVHPMANHNLFTDAAWFFPALSALNGHLSNPDSALKYVGQETRAGLSVEHLHYFTELPGGDPKDLTPRLSSEEIYLDSSSLLVAAVTFNEHPDNNAIVDIPVEIDFSDYRVINRVRVPFHIQKFFNGSLLLDVTVQSAALNTGLTTTDFAAQ